MFEGIFHSDVSKDIIHKLITDANITLFRERAHFIICDEQSAHFFKHSRCYKGSLDIECAPDICFINSLFNFSNAVWFTYSICSQFPVQCLTELHSYQLKKYMA